MARGKKFHFTYGTQNNEQHTVEIWVEGFAGTSEELQPAAMPVVVDYNKTVAESYMGGIVPAQITINVQSSSTFKASVFTSQNYGDVIIKHKTGSTVDFNCVLVPFVTRDIDLPDGAYGVELSCEFGLNYLKNVDYPTSTNRVKLATVLHTCISYVPVEDTFSYKILDGVLVASDSYGTDATRYFESYVSEENYADKTCYEVLDDICQGIREIFFSDGYWWVRNLAEINKGDSTIYNYSSAGAYVDSTAYARPTTEAGAGVRLKGAFGKEFSHKNVKITKPKSIPIVQFSEGEFDDLTDWTFEGLAALLFDTEDGKLTNLGNTIWNQTAETDPNYIVNTNPFTYQPFKNNYDLSDNEVLTLKLLAENGGQIKNLRLQIIAQQDDVYGHIYFLDSDGAWYRQDASTTQTPMYLVKNTNTEVKIEIPRPPYNSATFFTSYLLPIGVYEGLNYLIPPVGNVDYNIYIRIYLPERINDNSSGGADRFSLIDYVRFSIEKTGSEVFDGFSKDYGVTSPTDRTGKLDISFSTGFNAYPHGAETLFDASTGEKYLPYFKGVADILYNLVDDFVSRQYLDILSIRHKSWIGELYEKVDFDDLIEIDSVKYRVHNLKLDRWNKISKVTLVELASSTSSPDSYVIELPEDIKLQIEKIVKSNAEKLIFNNENFEISYGAGGIKELRLRANSVHDEFSSKLGLANLLKEGNESTTALNWTDIDGTVTDYIRPKADGFFYLKTEGNSEEQIATADTAWMLGGNDTHSIFPIAAGFHLKKNTDAQGVFFDTSQVYELKPTTFIWPNESSNLTTDEVTGDEDIYRTLATREWVDAKGDPWYTGGNIGLSGDQRIGHDHDSNFIIQLYGTDVAKFTPEGNAVFGYSSVTPLAVGHFHANVVGSTEVALFRASNVNVNNYFGVAVDPTVNEVFLRNSGTLRVKNTWDFDAKANFSIVPSSDQDPVLATDLVRKSYVDAVAYGIKPGGSVAAISLSNHGLSGLAAVDGYTPTAGDIILVAGNTDASENGPYVSASGAWSRWTEADTDAEIRGKFYLIENGTTHAGYQFVNTNSSAIEVDTTAITYGVMNDASETDPVFVAWRDSNRVANLVFAGPASGSSAPATFRALVADDIPALDYSKITSGKPSTIAGYGITDFSATANTWFTTKSTTGTNYLPKWDGSKFVNSPLNINSANGQLSLGVTNFASGKFNVASNGNISSISIYGIAQYSTYNNGNVLAIGTLNDGNSWLQASYPYVGIAKNLYLQPVGGYVGIRKQDPGYALDVAHDINYDGNLFIGGVAGTNKKVIGNVSGDDAWVSLDASYISDFSTVVNTTSDTWWEGINLATTGAIPKVNASGNLVDSNITEEKLNLTGLTTNRLLFWDGSSLETTSFFINSADIYGGDRRIRMYKDSGGTPEIGVFASNDIFLSEGAFGVKLNITPLGSPALTFNGYGVGGAIVPSVSGFGTLSLGTEDYVWSGINTHGHIYANGGISETLTLTEGSFERVLKGLYLSGGDTDTRETFFVGTDFNTGAGVFRLQYYNPSDVLSAVEMSFDLADAGRPIVYDPNDATEAIKHVMYQEDFDELFENAISGVSIGGGTVGNLNQVLTQGNNSSIRAQFNGVNYATVNDITSSVGTLDQVLNNGSNSSVRAQFNSVNYATVDDLHDPQNLASVLSYGTLAEDLEINFKATSASASGLSNGLKYLDESDAEVGLLNYNNLNDFLYLYCSNGMVINGQYVSITSNNVSLGTSIPQYADNASAIIGGLQAGRIYRTGDILKIVH